MERKGKGTPRRNLPNYYEKKKKRALLPRATKKRKKEGKEKGSANHPLPQEKESPSAASGKEIRTCEEKEKKRKDCSSYLSHLFLTV